ncbi:RNA polymerase I associated factor A49-like protein [Punctularia strigosozonata HHB-11173 SS5]|uniref:RNA polymerase I associated factor A49-like protein n=1 Tax=Punctularia strigosozonata (strain HHB-11173) TaxID=741275 RepID=UPI0004417211|nr:RNA polymerase I associated factor A49-like protein [Punctularia strigosozonata HHB-11173 SS5]EIN05934.1 RNA polymerase I associated factor A49-like protein [Punctularia strigosozonata HHB-11173 SS5]
MAAATAPSKKRKRHNVEADEAHNKITVKLSSQNAMEVGPVVASFPVQPPPKTSFKCYTRKRSRIEGEEATEFARRDMLVAGEADSVEYASIDEPGAGAGCRYYVAVHDKRTHTVTIRPAPLHIMQRTVKALKALKPAPVGAAERLAARNALQNTFGTKKAVTRMRAQERNRVDVDAMGAVAGVLQSTVEKNTEALPTKDEAQELADASRLIPPYDATATTPSEIYKLYAIVPQSELDSISAAPFLSASNGQERTALLAFRRSSWVNQHLSALFRDKEDGKGIDKRILKVIVYISAMIAFREATMRGRDFEKQKLQESQMLKAVPGPVLDGFLSRFAEQPRGSTKYQVTSQKRALLLAYMFALCLHVDNFATDTSLIANDLAQPTTKINPIFKSLGCSVKVLGLTELKRLGLPDSAAATKRAVLDVPLKFPAPRLRRRT